MKDKTASHALCAFNPRWHLCAGKVRRMRTCLCQWNDYALNTRFFGHWREYAFVLGTSDKQFELLFPDRQCAHSGGFLLGYKTGIEMFHPDSRYLTIEEAPAIEVVDGFNDGFRDGFKATLRAYTSLLVHLNFHRQLY